MSNVSSRVQSVFKYLGSFKPVAELAFPSLSLIIGVIKEGHYNPISATLHCRRAGYISLTLQCKIKQCNGKKIPLFCPPILIFFYSVGDPVSALVHISSYYLCASCFEDNRMIGTGQKQSVHKDGAMEGVNGVNVNEG